MKGNADWQWMHYQLEHRTHKIDNANKDGEISIAKVLFWTKITKWDREWIDDITDIMFTYYTDAEVSISTTIKCARFIKRHNVIRPTKLDKVITIVVVVLGFTYKAHNARAYTFNNSASSVD